MGLGFYIPKMSDASKKDQVILSLIYNILNQSHFSPAQVDDKFSEEVYDNFLENLDFSKRFFLQEDIKSLEVYRHSIDDEILASELNFFEASYAIYNERFEETHRYFEDILEKPFDFTINESYETDEEKLDFCKNETELEDRWRLYLKQRVLSRIEDKINSQEEDTTRSDTSVVKTFAELEIDARAKEMELHEEWFKSLADLDRLDWVGMYMNSITTIYDPHTQYFAPERKEDFEISMTGQLEGIGAQLTQKGEYVVISKIITGSACWKQGDLEEGDKILKVAQEGETDDEAIDAVGMSVRKLVKYIRGPKGTEVRLTVQKLDGSKMLIPIVRDVVELEATFAKSAVLGEGDAKIGYIRLPKFYVNFYDDENRVCSEDVKAEIEKLKADNVHGIILDLRNNGGGSLQEVIDIVGLFIKDGPVVQVKGPGQSPKVLQDEDSKIFYDGPLVVMVNQFSASASEIFAAAIQDYNRGIIIGSKSTFGKGTVQNVLDMDRAVNFTFDDVKPLGALKLTIQKYYRINGGTPQLRGVQSDIVLPDNFTYIKYGEAEEKHALPYSEIAPAKYSVWKLGTEAYPKAVKQSEARVKENEKFALIDEYAKWLKKQRDLTEVNLNYEAYRKEQVEFREKSKKFEGMRKSNEELAVSSNSADVSMWDASEEKQKERDIWFKGLRTDLYLNEAFHVAGDLK